MAKRSILFYSDCPFFAGCENMIPNFLNSAELHSVYNVYFVYRESDSYEKVLNSRVEREDVTYIPMSLPRQAVHRALLKTLSKESITYKVLAAFIVLIWKYYSILASIRPLYKVLKNKNIDILHINNGGYPAANTSYSVVIAAKIVGIKKIICIVNNIAEGYKAPLRWLDLLIDPFIKRSVNLFITGSKFASVKLVDVLGLKDDRVVNIPNGISPRGITRTKGAYLDSLNLNTNGRLVFSTIALLEERKGHIWLLKAIKFLKTKLTEEKFPLFIFEGKGSQIKILEEYISKNGLENDVILIGNTPHIFNLLNASDVIILPSIANEDFPNVIIEAMSLGKPTIGTKIAGIPEQIDDNENGFVVSPKNPEELAEAIIKLLDVERISSFSQKALQKFNANYTVNRSVETYLQEYKQLT